MSNTRTTPPDQAHPDPLIQRLLDWLKTAVSDLFTRVSDLEDLNVTERNRGATNVSTTAAVSGNTTSIAHGLSTTPTVVLATALNSAGGLTNVSVANVGATTFDLGIRYVDGVSRTATISVGWEAIA